MRHKILVVVNQTGNACILTVTVANDTAVLEATWNTPASDYDKQQLEAYVKTLMRPNATLDVIDGNVTPADEINRRKAAALQSRN